MATLATSLSERLATLPPAFLLERVASETLAQAARLQLAPEVVEASADIDGSPHDLWNAIDAGTLRLPYDPLWMEWRGVHSAHLASDKASLLPMDPSDSITDRIGALIRKQDDGRWSIDIGVRTTEGVAEWFPLTVLVGGVDLEVVTNAYTAWKAGADPATMRSLEGLSARACLSAAGVISIVALLTARNAPLVIGEVADDYSRLNRRRAKRGKPPALGCRPVRWDLSRDVHRNGGRALGEADRQRAVAHIVRGHFKIRKTGISWWRPHFRSFVPGGDLPMGRDYLVAA